MLMLLSAIMLIYLFLIILNSVYSIKLEIFTFCKILNYNYFLMKLNEHLIYSMLLEKQHVLG